MKQQKGILWLTETLALLSGKRKLPGCECMLWPSSEQRESQRHSGPRPLLHLPLTGMKAITSGWVITGPWVTPPKEMVQVKPSALQPERRMYAVKAWQTSCGGGNARRRQVCVQGNSSSGECGFPLWCRWGCNQPAFISEDRQTLGDTEQHCTSSEELCLWNALMESRCLIVCANKVWPAARTQLSLAQEDWS